VSVLKIVSIVASSKKKVCHALSKPFFTITTAVLKKVTKNKQLKKSKQTAKKFTQTVKLKCKEK
jgi:hypothetical protein